MFFVVQSQGAQSDAARQSLRTESVRQQCNERRDGVEKVEDGRRVAGRPAAAAQPPARAAALSVMKGCKSHKTWKAWHALLPHRAARGQRRTLPGGRETFLLSSRSC